VLRSASQRFAQEPRRPISHHTPSILPRRERTPGRTPILRRTHGFGNAQKVALKRGTLHCLPVKEPRPRPETIKLTCQHNHWLATGPRPEIRKPLDQRGAVSLACALWERDLERAQIPFPFSASLLSLFPCHVNTFFAKNVPQKEAAKCTSNRLAQGHLENTPTTALTNFLDGMPQDCPQPLRLASPRIT